MNSQLNNLKKTRFTTQRTSLRLTPLSSPQRQLYSLLFTCSSPVVTSSAHLRHLAVKIVVASRHIDP